MKRARIVVLALGGLIVVATPLLLLRPAPVAEAPVAPPLLAPPAAPPLSAVYARDLFGTAGEVTGEDAALPADAPQLIGIVGRIGSDAVAMVRGADGKTRTLAIGEGVDGWTLESLAIDAGFFTRGGQRLRVPLPAG